MNRWPHQLRGVQDVLAAIASGKRRIVLQSPTGMGKTVIMQDLALHYLGRKLRCILYTNRTMLIDQTSHVMDEAGIPHGVISPDADAQMYLPFQVAMAQTVHQRVIKRQTMQLFDADLVLIDEAHLQTGDTMRAILEAHYAQGTPYVGFTATPIDLGDTYQTLVVAGTAAEGRDCGALVLAHHFGCDEPDMRQFKKLRETSDTISENDARKAMMTPGIFGRVLEWFKTLNPQHRPTILFAPGVSESIWFAEQFEQAGITAAHIDGTDVWAHGKLYRSSPEVRASVLEASKTGKCPVLCNRFVLREGVDAPWLAHCILATVFGVLSSFLQSGGRLLRAHHSLDHVTIQDHGGNYWRWGSLNADRRWFLGATNTMMYGLRADGMREQKIPQPRPCPKCRAVQIWKSATCQFCGHECKPGIKISRPVVQTDGTLREMSGDIFRPHRVSTRPDGPAKWKSMYFRSLQPKAKGRTFRAAAALFAQENYWAWPSRDWPYMPVAELDFFRRVIDVPEDCLIQPE